MNQSTTFTGTFQSLESESFAPRVRLSDPENAFCNPQNGRILIEESFGRCIAQVRSDIADLKSQQRAVEAQINAFVEASFEVQAPDDETLDERLEMYRIVAELLENCTNQLDGLAELCEWMRHQYQAQWNDYRRMDLEAWTELQSFREALEKERLRTHHPDFKTLKGTPRL
jgi:hypothetical protein